MANTQALSWIGWYILPGKLAEWLLYLYYGLTIRAGDPKPQPGSPRHARHRRNAFAVVIACYFLYTVYEADWELQRSGNFYRDLGVPLDVTEKGLQSRFRKLYVESRDAPTGQANTRSTVLYHPDKIADAAQRDAAGEYFVHLKLARDTLVDPAKRFAYDRFGRDMLDWRGCITVRDFVMAGMRRVVQNYVASGVVIGGMMMLGYLDTGRFWRLLLFSLLGIIEFTTLTDHVAPIVLSRGVNPLVTFLELRPAYLPFQFLAILHRAALSGFIAISQLAPLFPGSDSSTQSNSPQAEAMQARQLDRLESAVRGVTLQTGRLLEFEMAPFAADDAAAREVKARFREWLVQNTVRSDPEVRDRIGRAMVARRSRPGSGT